MIETEEVADDRCCDADIEKRMSRCWGCYLVIRSVKVCLFVLDS